MFHTDEVQKKTKIIETCSAVFLNSDVHRWNVNSSFADTVHLDYTSLSGPPTADVKSADIIKAWSSSLPKFTFTRHYLTKDVVSIHENHAATFCYGHAIHQLKGAERGNFGKWMARMILSFEKMNGEWKIISLRHTYKYASMNLNSAALAPK